MNVEKEEWITIHCYGSNNTAIIKELIDEAVENSIEQDKGLLGIY